MVYHNYTILILFFVTILLPSNLAISFSEENKAKHGLSQTTTIDQHLINKQQNEILKKENSLLNKFQLRTDTERAFSLNSGEFFGGWGRIKGWFYRKDDDGVAFRTTFYSGFEVEDIWGNNILDVEIYWHDWWQIDSQYFSDLPTDEYVFSRFACGNECCGPVHENNNLDCVIKSDIKLAYRDGQFIFLKNGQIVSDSQLGYSSKVTRYTYKPQFRLKCQATKVSKPEISYLPDGIGDHSERTTKERLERSLSIQTETTSNFQWFTEATVSSNSGVSVELPKVGSASRTLGWEIKGGFKYEKTVKVSKGLKSVWSKEVGTISKCSEGKDRYLVTTKKCVEFDVGQCKAFGVKYMYRKKSQLYFENNTMKGCRENTFYLCIKGPIDQKTKDKIEQYSLNNSVKDNSLPTHTVGNMI